jgi:membrane protein
MAHETLAKLKKIQAQAAAFFTGREELVRDESGLSRLQKFLHFCLFVYRSFDRNRCPVRASALAYASLLALVPMLAIVLSVSSSLLKKQGEEPIYQFVEKLVASVTPKTGLTITDSTTTPDDTVQTPTANDQAVKARKEIARRIKDFIDNTRSGTLGVTGMVALVTVGILMLGRIEDTFNDIWGVTQGRSWFARVVQYWAALTLGPLLLMVALGLTSGPHLQTTKDILAELPFGMGRVATFLFKFLPFVILSVTFALFYQLMPNTKVQWKAAFIGGTVGGCLWQLNNIFSVLYVSRIVTNSKIYGSLGAVPVFMIGLYVSWYILLLGAQVAYAFQNRKIYFQEKQVESVNQRGREFIAFRMMTIVGQSFQRGEKAPSTTEIAQMLAVPTRLVSRIFQALVSAKLVIEVLNGETGYAPARPLAQITCHDILHALRAGQGQELATQDDSMRELVRQEFEKVQQAEREVAQATTLEALVNRGNVSLPAHGDVLVR